MLAAAGSLTLRTVLPRRRILAYPRAPSKFQILYRILLLLGYKMVTDPKSKYDVALIFQPGTRYSPMDLSPVKPVGTINKDVRDVSKRKVEAKFEEVFGYSVGINPATHQGLALRKSDENYKHDGEIIRCPYFPKNGEKGVTYQHYIDARAANGCFADLRVPIYDDEIPIVSIKYRPDTEQRFKEISHSEQVPPNNVLSAEEQQLLVRLARAMGMDYGEMDVLRDNCDGRIYVVDVNPCPAGLVNGFTKEQRQRSLVVLAPAFSRMVERRVKAGETPHK